MHDFLRALYGPRDGGAWAPVAAFGGPKAPPPPPPPQPMPDLQDPAILAQARKAREAAMARSGRLSTMLTGDTDYSSDKLGLR